MTTEEKKAWKGFLNQWPWEWFMTLNLSSKGFERTLKQCMIQLQREEKLQVAYWGVSSFKTNRHLHILALGKNRRGESLLNCDPSKWERCWGKLSHKSAAIRVIPSLEDQDRIIGYMVDANTPRYFHETLTPYNEKLLRRTKRI